SIHESVAATHQIAASVSELQRQSQQLLQAIAFFKDAAASAGQARELVVGVERTVPPLLTGPRR
ncbi:MAG TPA: hypothetical protein V6D05_18105, partial [Stenomitos sp.]